MDLKEQVSYSNVFIVDQKEVQINTRALSSTLSDE
jgi:hypothetical protein